MTTPKLTGGTGKWNHQKRKSRAGKDTRSSGHYVRSRVPPVEDDAAQPEPLRERAPVTLPRLAFLEPKMIGGELI